MFFLTLHDFKLYCNITFGPSRWVLFRIYCRPNDLQLFLHSSPNTLLFCSRKWERLALILVDLDKISLCSKDHRLHVSKTWVNVCPKLGPGFILFVLLVCFLYILCFQRPPLHRLLSLLWPGQRNQNKIFLYLKNINLFKSFNLLDSQWNSSCLHWFWCICKKQTFSLHQSNT